MTHVEQRARPGRFYWRLEEDDNGASSSIFEYPIDFYSAVPVPFIYSLPNGMQAYGIEGIDGSRRTSLPLHCVSPNCPEPTLLNAVGCQGCHEAGLVTVTDRVREYFESNARLFDTGTGELIRATYPGAPEFAQLLDTGSQLHLEALQRAGVTPGGPEPISFVYYQFERTELGLRRVAGELDVTPERLEAVLPSASGSLAPLLAPDGVIQRPALDSAYLATRCELEAESRNRPVACP